MLREDPITIIYDGDCPLCRTYCRMIRLNAVYGRVELLNAREHSRRVKEIQAQGYDLDEGMIVNFNGRIYYGSEAINILALLSTRSDSFNRITSQLFRSRRVATILYPVLKAYRNCILFILGRNPINHKQG